MMVEAERIANALGIAFPIDVDKRIAGAAAVGEHKTSMLQDREPGRPMEIDALVTAVQELGRLTGTPTPSIDIVLALVIQKARLARACYAPFPPTSSLSTYLQCPPRRFSRSETSRSPSAGSSSCPRSS